MAQCAPCSPYNGQFVQTMDTAYLNTRTSPNKEGGGGLASRGPLLIWSHSRASSPAAPKRHHRLYCTRTAGRRRRRRSYDVTAANRRGGARWTLEGITRGGRGHLRSLTHIHSGRNHTKLTVILYQRVTSTVLEKYVCITFLLVKYLQTKKLQLVS